MARKGLLRQNKAKTQKAPKKIRGIIRQKKAEQKKKEEKSSSLFSSLGVQARATSTEPILRQTNSETRLARDSQVVHISGTESISGEKQFINGAVFHSDLAGADTPTGGTVTITGDSFPILAVSGNLMPMIVVASNFNNWSSTLGPGGYSIVDSKMPLNFQREYYFGVDGETQEWIISRRVNGDAVSNIIIPSATCATLLTTEDASRFIPYTPTSGVLVGNPNYAEAPGLYAIGLGSAVHATGETSFAAGPNASAIGKASVAIGRSAYADGLNSVAIRGEAFAQNSVAIGLGEAHGRFSTVVGGRSGIASGINSTIIGGYYNQANADFSIALGYKSYIPNELEHSLVWNGTEALGLSDKYMAHGPGTFNINPSAGISGVYIGEENLPTILSNTTKNYIPYTATSGIMVGDPNYAEATGDYAVALGSAVHATGKTSVALGRQASALALNAIAIGGTSLAKGAGSLAMNGGKAYGGQSVAIGPAAEASANFSYAIGRTAKANDIYALALGGLYNQSDAKYSITMGYRSRAYPQSQHSFTWNGSTSLGTSNEYTAKGGGTFNINPSAGISGFYIGTKNLYTILSEQGGVATGDFLPLSGGEVSADFKLTVNGGTNFLSGGTDEVTLALGRNSVAYNGADTAIGAHCSVEGYDNTALGCQSSVGKANSSLPGPDGGAEEVALGAYSHAMGGLDCVQLGRGTNNEPYSLKVLGTQTLMSKSGQSSDDLVLVCPVSGYLALTGGEVSGDVNEEIDWPYIRMENVLLQDESDGTSNKVLVNISIEATSAELNIGRQTGDCPSPITVNTEIVGVTGTPSQFPFDIAALSGEKQVPYNTSDKFYEYTNGNSQIEIYIEQTGAISYYFASSDDEHYYGTESIPPTETTKKISSRFITEVEIDSKIKSGGAAFDRWRKGNTIYAGTGSDHLSAGTNNSVFIGSNQSITDGKGNSVVIGSNTQSKTGSVVVIGNNAKVTDANSVGHVVIGANSQGYGYGASVAVGNSAKACYLGVAIGPEANAEHENAVAVGWRTKPRTNKDIAIGREAQTSGGDGNQSNIAIGAWSKAFTTGGSPAITIGGGTVSGNMSIALGGSVYANDAIQLGYGSNTTPNTLQYRNHKIADTAGKLYQNNVDIEDIYQKKVLLESVIGDSSNPASTVEISEDYNIYQFWVGSNGTFPTFTFSFPNFGSTQARFQFTLLVHVDSGATTLTGPSGWVWVSGAGLPSSGFAGKAIWISGLKRTNDPTEPPLVSCWRCA